MPAEFPHQRAYATQSPACTNFSKCLFTAGAFIGTVPLAHTLGWSGVSAKFMTRFVQILAGASASHSTSCAGNYAVVLQSTSVA